jgi:hypothetical protein
VRRFRYQEPGPLVRVWLSSFGVRPSNSWVEVGDGRVMAKFGRWQIRTPLENVAEAKVTGPYRAYRSVGLRLSLADRGVTFGTTSGPGVCITFREPVRSVTVPPWKHPSLTVTVEEPHELVDVLSREMVSPSWSRTLESRRTVPESTEGGEVASR